jgi:hypothetical protein
MAGPNTRARSQKSPGVPTGICQSATASPAAHALAALHNAEILGGIIRSVTMAMRPAVSTSLAYNPKQAEFDSFCDHVYSNYQPSMCYYTIGTEKVFLFLF